MYWWNVQNDGYEEEVPRWLIDELFPNEPEENYMMHCPECDHKMIVKNNSATKRQMQNVLLRYALFVVPHNQQIVTISTVFHIPHSPVPKPKS